MRVLRQTNVLQYSRFTVGKLGSQRGNMNWNLFVVVIVFLAGGIGTLARYGVGVWLSGQTGPLALPLATFLVNSSGCFVFGLLGPLATAAAWPDWVRIALFTGLLGGWTTFSAYISETVGLQQTHPASHWLFLWVAHNGVGLLLFWLGQRLAHFGLSQLG